MSLWSPKRKTSNDVIWVNSNYGVIEKVKHWCNRLLCITDLGNNNYEVYCYHCEDFDPGKYRTIKSAVEGAKVFTHRRINT